MHTGRPTASGSSSIAARQTCARSGWSRRRHAPASAHHGVPIGPPASVCSDDSLPSFAPDGRHIVFAHASGRIGHESKVTGSRAPRSCDRSRGGKLTVLRRLTGFRGGFGQPQVSPDGAKLVFRRDNSRRIRPANGQAIFVVNVNGSGLRRLTPWSLRATGPDWSPDGSRILFASNALEGNLASGTNLYSSDPTAPTCDA